MEQFPHGGFLPTRLGDTSGAYAKWRYEVLLVRELPEYKLKKLWRLNYSPKDIENNKHWERFPPADLTKKMARGVNYQERRGRTMSRRSRQACYARVLRQEAERLINNYRMEPKDLADARAELEWFKGLAKKFSCRG